MNYFIGVDGGGTSTVFLLSDEAGNIIATSKQSTIHYLQCGFEGVANVLNKGINTLLESNSLNISDISYIFVACAGYGDIPSDTKKLDAIIQETLCEVDYSVGNDTDNALAGSLAGNIGINIISGTGSIGLGIDGKGNSFRSGGWNHLFGGDEGSAFWLASNMLRIFTRQADGRDEKTLLYSYLMDTMHWDDSSEMLTQCIVEWEYDRTLIASLAIHIFELAKMGDPVAIKLYEDAAKELAEIAYAIKKEMNLMDGTLVSYSGSVFKAEDFILAPFNNYLQTFGLSLTSPVFGPEIGSIILAMQRYGLILTDDILKNLSK